MRRGQYHTAVLSINKTVLQSSGYIGFNPKKTPANQSIKLELNGKRFNVRFYCNDGRYYYALWFGLRKVIRFYVYMKHALYSCKLNTIAGKYYFSAQ
jgi:hypothetical protein